MIGRCELRMVSPAEAHRSKPMRHALAAFLAALELDSESIEDVLTAVGEALANAVEHAYQNRSPGSVEVFARTNAAATLLVDVTDSGVYLDRERTIDRGFGMHIIGAIAHAVSVDRADGTRISMTFDIGHLRALR